MKKILLQITLLLSLNCISWANDIDIAEKLLRYYMSVDLQLDDLEKVMEFDNENSIALIEKAKLLGNNISLYDVKSLLERSKFVTELSKVMYIETLYQLKDYNGLVQFYNVNIFSTDLPAAFYYRVINSFIYLEEYENAKELYSQYQSSFKNTIEFLELGFLLFRDKAILDELLYKQQYTVIIRLYNRVEMDDLLELYIYSFVDDLDNLVIGNYKLLNLLTSRFSMQYNDFMLLDNNSDSIVETEMNFKNNVLLSKQIDFDQDNIQDYTLLLDDGIPVSIMLNNKKILFKTYPYVDTVIINESDVVKYKIPHKLYRYELINPLLFNPDLHVFDIDIKNISLDWIKEYDNETLKKKIYYITDKDYLIYEDYRGNHYYKISHFVNGVLYRSLMDLDYDNIFDFYELYNSDRKVLSAYSKNGDPQNIDNIEMNLESDSKYVKEISFNWNSYTEK